MRKRCAYYRQEVVKRWKQKSYATCIPVFSTQMMIAARQRPFRLPAIERFNHTVFRKLPVSHSAVKTNSKNALPRRSSGSAFFLLKQNGSTSWYRRMRFFSYEILKDIKKAHISDARIKHYLISVSNIPYNEGVHMEREVVKTFSRMMEMSEWQSSENTIDKNVRSPMSMNRRDRLFFICNADILSCNTPWKGECLGMDKEPLKIG